MSLDKLEKNITRWTLRSDHADFLNEMACIFNMQNGVHAASLTAQTLNVEVDQDIVSPDTLAEAQRIIENAGALSFLHVISSNVPEL